MSAPPIAPQGLPQIREDPTTGARVVLSGDRGHRPIRLVTPTLAAVEPRDCPFCPGNEGVTLPTLASREGPDGWLVRAFPNRFPALRVEGGLDGGREGPWGWASGVGAHEVIAESREHALPLWDQPESMRLALHVARERLADLRRDARLAHVAWFRNHGALAGASQPHPHAQIVGSHVVSAHMANVADRMQASVAPDGLMGAIVRHELDAGVRIVGADARIVALCPYAPRFSYETWLVPADGGPRFDEAADEAVDALAAAMCDVLGATADVIDLGAYNAVLYTAPRGRERGFGWHVRLTPRRVALGGYELMSGGTILHVPPEESAARLRPAVARRAQLRSGPNATMSSAVPITPTGRR
ncbi:MAG TPA: hypothetical protein PKA64_13330 [Myxococcota bacterium]|nr:hypothetical protein [Myxococcota bacterium]